MTMPKKHSAKLHAKAKDLYEKGLDFKEIKKITEISIPTLKKWAEDPERRWKEPRMLRVDERELPIVISDGVDLEKPKKTVKELDAEHEQWLQDLGEKIHYEASKETPNVAKLNSYSAATNSLTKIIKAIREDIRGIDKKQDAGIVMPKGFAVNIVAADGSLVNVEREKLEGKDFMFDLPNQDPYEYKPGE